MKLGVRLIWEQLSCHVLHHRGDRMHPLGASEDVNKKVNAGPMKDITPWVQRGGSSQQLPSI